MAQLKKLQMTLARTTTKTAQPATCLMVIMLSVALVMAPNLRLTQNNENEVAEQDISTSDHNLSPIAGYYFVFCKLFVRFEGKKLKAFENFLNKNKI